MKTNANLLIVALLVSGMSACNSKDNACLTNKDGTENFVFRPVSEKSQASAKVNPNKSKTHPPLPQKTD